MKWLRRIAPNSARHPRESGDPEPHGTTSATLAPRFRGGDRVGRGVLARRLLRDPLIHFLIAGGLLFALYAVLRPDAAAIGDDRTIVVDRPALLKFMQYQSAAFAPAYFARQLDAMTPGQRQALVDRYVREDALVREARAMGLDTVDYVIRQRLVQKTMYLIDDAATATTNPADAELQRYFKRHQGAYQVAASFTFTHVFIDKEVAHGEGALAVAQRLQAQLEARHARFDDAPAYGDRFPFLQNYVDRAPDFVASQFGAGFVRTLAGLQPSPRWQGPIPSDYGHHLVLLTARAASQPARFEDVRDQVKDDYLADAMAAYRDKAIADLVRHYRVEQLGLTGTHSGNVGKLDGQRGPDD